MLVKILILLILLLHLLHLIFMLQIKAEMWSFFMRYTFFLTVLKKQIVCGGGRERERRGERVIN